MSLAERLTGTERPSGNGEALGPLDGFLRDPEVTEIMVNNADTIYVERGERVYWTGAKFDSEEQLRRTIDKILSRVGRRLDESSPYAEARMPDGSWVNAIIPPLALDGAVLTIRKFSQDLYTAKDLVSFGTWSSAVAQFLDACVQGRINMLVSGTSESGRTTMLNALASFIPDPERIITVEEAAELRLQQPHVVRLQAKPADAEGNGEVSVRDLVRHALRMRPNRILPGELRGGEATEMLRAIHTGLDGWMTTVYANSPRDALARLETLVRLGGMELAPRAVRQQVATGIQLVVHQARMRDGSRRVIHVAEVLGMEGDAVRLQDLFVLDSKGFDRHGRLQAELKPTGVRPRFLDVLRERANYLPPALLMQDEKGLGR